MPDAVHASMLAVEVALAHPALYAVLGQTRAHQLGASDHSVLCTRDLSDSLLRRAVLPAHIAGK